MVKTKIVEVQAYFCDNCGKEIHISSDDKSFIINSVDNYEIHLCEDCRFILSRCDECGRVALSEDNLFANDYINDGYYLCSDCLENKLDGIKNAVSAAEMFISRHTK